MSSRQEKFVGIGAEVDGIGLMASSISAGMSCRTISFAVAKPTKMHVERAIIAALAIYPNPSTGRYTKNPVSAASDAH